MLNNPQSRSWKTLSLILLLAAAAGFVMLNLLSFGILLTFTTYFGERLSCPRLSAAPLGS